MQSYPVSNSQVKNIGGNGWKDAKNCVEQPSSNMHCDGDCLQLHDGACGGAVD